MYTFKNMVLATSIVLFVFSQNSFSNDNYLLGVDAAHKKKYEDAIGFISGEIIDFNASNLKEQIKFRIWLGFSYLARDKHHENAIPYLIDALCYGLPKKHLDYLQCEKQMLFTESLANQEELNRIVAALAALATWEWGVEKYELAMSHYTLVNKLIIEGIEPHGERDVDPGETNPKTLSGQSRSFNYEKITSFKQLFVELAKREVILKEKMKSEIMSSVLSKNTNTKSSIKLANLSVMEEYQSLSMKKMLAEKYLKMRCKQSSIADSFLNQVGLKPRTGYDLTEFSQKLKHLGSAEPPGKNCEVMNTIATATTNGRSLEKIQTRENDYFYSLATPIMCRDWGKSDVGSFESVMNVQNSAFGSWLEAYRGNLLSVYKMAQPLVLESIRNYFTSLDTVIINDRSISQQSRYRKQVRECGKRSSLFNGLSLSIIGIMNRGGADVVYYQDVLNTLLLISKGDNNSKMQLMTYKFLGDRLVDLGEIEQGVNNYRKAINAMKFQEMDLELLDWTRTLVSLGAVLHQQGKPLDEIYSAIAMLEAKHNSLLSDFNSAADLDEEGSIRDQVRTSLEKVNSTLGENRAITQELISNMNIPEEQIRKITQKFEEAQTKIQSKDMRDMLTKKMTGFQQGKMSMSGQFSSDFGGTIVERQRTLINENRIFKLGIAEVMLAIDDLSGTEKWLSSYNDIGPKVFGYEYYNTNTLALEAYVRAKYYRKLGQINQAKSHYAKAIKHWYFNPRRPLELFMTFFSTTTSLLEEAAIYELENGGLETAFYYFELARHAFIDSDQLYGRMSQQDLKQYQSQLELMYKKLIADAQRQAEQQDEIDEYSQAEENSKARKQNSMRDQVTPLMPLYTAMIPYLPWIDKQRMQLFMGDMERFNTLWENHDLRNFRQGILTSEYNTQLKMVADGGEEGMFGEEILFRSARGSKDIASPSFSIIEQKNRNSHLITNYVNVQHNLAPDETILTYWVSPLKTYAFAATRDNLTSLVIPTSEMLVQIQIISDKYDRDVAVRLYNMLLFPFQNNLKKDLIIVANGPLKNLSFSSLVNNNDEYFGDSYPMRHYPNIDTVFGKKSRGNKKKQLLVLAPGKVEGQVKLDFPEEEAKAIEKIFNTKVYRDDEVTRSFIKKELSLYKIVHFAGHAKLDEFLPDFSRLILAKDDSGQSSFYVRDIKNMDLRGIDLVVLSACETGNTSKFNLNNEFSALNSAFLFAGADSVVATLRRVEDKVAFKMMNQFYLGLARGLKKDIALQQAQQYVRDNVSSDPNDWASFMLSGSNRPVSL